MATTPDEPEPEPDPAPTPRSVSSARIAVKSPRPTWPVIVTVALVGIAGLVVLFCIAPEFVPDEAGGDPVRAARTTGVATLRAAVLAGGLGLAAVLTLMFNARTAHTAEQNLYLTRQAQDDARDVAERQAQATQDTLDLNRQAQNDARGEADAQAQATQESLRLTRQAQVAERYSAAVELLSGGTTTGESREDDHTADSTARTTVELGGIYALEQLARESRDYRAIVVEVLSAFIRSRAALQPNEVVGWSLTYRPDGQDAASGFADEFTDPPMRDHAASTLAALTVLGRIAPPVFTAAMETVHALGSVDGPARRGPIRADLRKINLRGVDLTSGASRQPDFGFADFDRSDLTGVYLLGADLRHASFDGADLSGAMMRDANLTGADLNATWLHRTYLSGADLGGVDLRTARGLIQEQVDSAKGDANTQLPEGIRRPASWENPGD